MCKSGAMFPVPWDVLMRYESPLWDEDWHVNLWRQR